MPSAGGFEGEASAANGSGWAAWPTPSMTIPPGLRARRRGGAMTPQPVAVWIWLRWVPRQAPSAV